MMMMQLQQLIYNDDAITTTFTESHLYTNLLNLFWQDIMLLSFSPSA